MRVAIAAVMLAWGALAAEVAEEPVRVRFRGHAKCPGEDAFFAAIRGRTARVRLARGDEEARTFRVVVDEERGRSVGRIEILDAHASSSPRTVSADTCEEVVDALALIAALSVDPSARTAPIALPPVAASPPTDAGEALPSDAGAPSNAAADASPPPREAPPETPVAERRVTPIPRAPRASQVGWPLTWSVGAHADLAGFAAPGARVGVRGFLDVAFGRSVRHVPSLRISAAWMPRGEVAVASGAAALGWTTVRFDGCPLAYGAAGLVFHACADVEAGVLLAEGIGVDNAQSRPRPWASVGPLARLGYAFLGPLSLEIQGGFAIPLVREHFYFSPTVDAYTAPPVALHGGAGLLFAFP